MNDLSLEQKLTSELSRGDFSRILTQQSYEYKSIFINRIRPDNNNARFFPAVIASDQLSYQITTRRLTKAQLVERLDCKDTVVIGKSCIVNCFNRGTVEWKKANDTIASILELAAHVSVSELIQVPTIYPLENDSYQILTGHRRFFAMVYTNGIDGAAHFKVYHNKPSLPRTKQFQENASREDLPKYGKLQAFQEAMLELDTLGAMRQKTEGKSLTVREISSLLGISMGAFDNYNVLTRYPAVLEAYQNGNSTSFIAMKKIVVNEEQKVREQTGQTMLNIEQKRAINKQLKNILSNARVDKGTQKKKRYRLGTVDSPELMKVILTENLLAMDTSIDWDSINWAQPKEVNEAFERVVSFLKNRLESQQP
ncbi:ParB/Srx family N-terminal domain-containing protein [Alkalimonas amylolytica]|uniref:Uncharacterized protein n=1 Tax=Alkalimonas amylolytica TaxID=152573 RepID=A0A1H4AX60_ALKAM|nr:ParB/Srx family N-terminal domain-containing protein [Alkalimonas amylolytica]SEA40414.1 hypothetical protein SAMN04488051_10365 [Alkalimonas amylolytica]